MASKDKATKPFLVGNLEWLNRKGKIWLNPAYQRESVWTRSQKQLLIDSLLIEIDIPKMYLRQVDHEGYEYECVDGQQRLRAIFEYMNDGFKLVADSDPVDGNPTKSLSFSELDTDLQMKLRNVPLDIVVLSRGYTDDDIEEMFLRLQNGTPLNAAEKRRALAGNMRHVVGAFGTHPVFALCAFENKRFAYEDAVAKTLHLLLFGGITDIRPESIRRTYERNQQLDMDSASAKQLKSSYNFLTAAFKDKQNPRLKKYSIITLGYLLVELLDEFDLSKHKDEFAESYLSFETERIANEEKPEEVQDAGLAAFTDAARSDSIPSMKYRHEVLRARIIADIPTLALKDLNRDFTDEQRMAIYRRDGGQCKMCGKPCDETDFHADHVVAHANGGQTTIANGQVLCPVCNQKKSDN